MACRQPQTAALVSGRAEVPLLDALPAPACHSAALLPSKVGQAWRAKVLSTSDSGSERGEGVGGVACELAKVINI